MIIDVKNSVRDVNGSYSSQWRCVLGNSGTGQLAHFNPATLQSTTMAEYSSSESWDNLDYPEVHPELAKYHNIDYIRHSHAWSNNQEQPCWGQLPCNQSKWLYEGPHPRSLKTHTKLTTLKEMTKPTWAWFRGVRTF